MRSFSALPRSSHGGVSGSYVTIFSIASVLNAGVVVSLWYPANVPPLLEAHSTLKILDMNVYYGNTHYKNVAAEIGKYSADVVVIEELTSEMLGALQPALTAFPYRVVNVENKCWGIGIFSRHKLVNCSANPLSLPQPNVISADIELDSGNVTLEAIHTAPRYSRMAVDTDRLLVERLKKRNGDLKTPIILVGDFNATPWSDLFRNLSGTANFFDSEQGCGPALSWPVGVPILALPIDHCLYDRKWRTAQRRLGSAMGSDHLPLYIQLEIPHDQRGKPDLADRGNRSIFKSQVPEGKLEESAKFSSEQRERFRVAVRAQPSTAVPAPHIEKY